MKCVMYYQIGVMIDKILIELQNNNITSIKHFVGFFLWLWNPNV